LSGLYNFIWPFIRLIDPETAHGFALSALKRGWFPIPEPFEDKRLNINLWGIEFENPIGLAAGFDKNAVAPDAMLLQGFGHVEVGTVTPREQYGNARPRLFRLNEDRAVINRNGFNNKGMDVMFEHLDARSSTSKGYVGVNFGKNKDTKEALDDYVVGINKLAQFAQYIVVNVSSPNTPGLRALQGKDPLFNLLQGVRNALEALNLPKRPPILLKVAPDLTEVDKRDISKVILELRIDGLITTNTTIERPDKLKNKQKGEVGGLSGQPLFGPSTKILSDFYKLTDGKIPLIGVGGVGSGQQAYSKIRAGASLVQLYSALVYEGPGLANDIKRELAQLLERDGFDTVADAIGIDHH
jgi:dihydroorotate dehydrogenase